MISAIDAQVASLLAAPTITSPSGTTNANTVDGQVITFSEAVSNSNNVGNFEIVTASSPGQGTLGNNPNSSVPGGGNTTAALDWLNTQSPVDGNILLRVNPASGSGARITDSVFYTPVELAQTDLLFSIDVAAPDAFTVGAVTPVGGTVVPGYWNASNTSVNVTVPVADDATLNGGTIQLQARVGLSAFEDLGGAVAVGAADINTDKTINIPAATFEGITGFADGAEVSVRAIITDAASKPTTGTQSADTLVVDQTAPAAFTVGAVTPVGGTVTAGQWNASNLSLDVHVPIADDATLEGGSVQVQARVGSSAFEDLGGAAAIAAADVNGNKTINIPAATFEGITGFADGVEVSVRAIITDSAENALTGAQSGDTITVDQGAPSISISAPSLATAGSSDSVDYTITYTGADSVTLALTDITPNATGDAAGPVGISGSGNSTRTVTISNPTGNGTLGISIAAGTASDTAGNSAPAAGPSVTFNVVNVATTADPFVRDNIDDDGTEPSAGSLSLSPDIIVFKSSGDMLLPLQDNYGGTDPLVVDNYNIGSEAESGQDNYIIVRAYNRGGATATNVQARVYFAQFSTSILPEDWTEIGVVSFPSDIPNDGTLYVSDALTWPGTGGGAVPSEGHYCLIATIWSDSDPEPLWSDIVASVTDSASYMQYIRDVNNITYRNIHVADDIVPLPPPAPDAPPPGSEIPPPGEEPAPGEPLPVPDGYYPLSFNFTGAAGEKKLPMVLEILIHLPKDSRAILEVPLDILKEIMEKGKDFELLGKSDKLNIAWINIHPHKNSRFGEFMVDPKKKVPMRLFVRIPGKSIYGRYRIYARQLYKDQELGRVALFIGRGWGPKKKPFFLYRFFRAILDTIFFIRKKPRYNVKY